MKQITIIPPEEAAGTYESRPREQKRRAAAYARVSTDREEQNTSYESQIDYYTRMIKDTPELEFAGVYADDGISGTSTKSRKGFNEMVCDALDGKIDIIYTKSVSRFARNTVDSLTTIRKLKDAGCEVYFEKENIYTFDSKGELLITIMSSLAQEESRSLSENVTWGTRKRFADGKYTIHCKEFLGYDRGPDGEPVINAKEAATVRRIYYMCLEGISPYGISKILNSEGVKTPMGKDNWHYSVIKSILQNEKYKGDALLQKTYSTSFLTKKRKPNNGELPRYLVENGHPAIIDRKTFDEVQTALSSYKTSRFTCSDKKYSKRVKCGVCGSWYCETLWKNGTSSKKVWRCNKKFENGNCKTPYLTPERIEYLFGLAYENIKNNEKAFKKAVSKLRTPAKQIKARRLEAEQIRKYIRFDKESRSAGRISELEEQINRLTRINSLIKRAHETPYPELLSLSESEGVIELLIDYIEITGDGDIISVDVCGEREPVKMPFIKI